MKAKKYWIFLVLILIISGCSCDIILESSLRGGNKIDEQMSSEIVKEADAKTNEQESLAVAEESLTYELETLLPENPVGEMYYWVFLQNGRKMVSQTDVQKINDRLHELGLDSTVGFHIITIEDYITPGVLTQIYEDLDGKMDFVSIGSGLCGFYMDEWEEEFIDLTKELQRGELQQLYTAVPDVVWNVNQINEKILSFANVMFVSVPGYAFYEEDIEKYGAESLMKIIEAKGVENIEVWDEVCEDIGDGVFKWSKVTGGKPISIAENPYERVTLTRLANSYEQLYYVYLTDDIRYCIENERFEWLPESVNYLKVKNAVESLSKKGYLGNITVGTSYGGFVATCNTTSNEKVIHSKDGDIDFFWVPFWKEKWVSKPIISSNYMYSFVYKEAKDGWGNMLECLCIDEYIADILNQSYFDVTISAVIYEDWDETVFAEKTGNQYEIVKKVYETAQTDPTGGFIFNPVPIQDEWKEYNRVMSMYAGIPLIEDNGQELVPRFDIINTVCTEYLSIKEEAHIDLVLAEVNRQYTEWKNSQID